MNIKVGNNDVTTKAIETMKMKTTIMSAEVFAMKKTDEERTTIQINLRS